jgi:hypothetical protein
MIGAVQSFGRWSVCWIESTLTHSAVASSVYCLDINTVRDETDAAHWSRQLGEKTWVTVQDLADLRDAMHLILKRNRECR